MSHGDDYIPLSAINHYSYCPRRCALIHLEGEFSDNVHTVAGTHRHIAVDCSRLKVTEGTRIELALSVWSDRLRVRGRCDVVEFRVDGSVCPVEYKLGRRKRWTNDDLQVAAQAMCLEEMLNLEIPLGLIFHHKSRRLREVLITEELRAQTKEVVEAIHRLLEEANTLPPPTEKRQRCPECSLEPICQPDLWRAARNLEGVQWCI